LHCRKQGYSAGSAGCTDRQVHIKIGMPPSTSGVDAVNQILSKVFAGGLLESRIAAYWKPKVSFEGRDVWQLMDGIRKNSPDGIIAELKGNRPAYMVNLGL